jgi:hypothetical protein
VACGQVRPSTNCSSWGHEGAVWHALATWFSGYAAAGHACAVQCIGMGSTSSLRVPSSHCTPSGARTAQDMHSYAIQVPGPKGQTNVFKPRCRTHQCLAWLLRQHLSVQNMMEPVLKRGFTTSPGTLDPPCRVQTMHHCSHGCLKQYNPCLQASTFSATCEVALLYKTQRPGTPELVPGLSILHGLGKRTPPKHPAT